MKTIAIGILIVALTPTGSAAQTAAERERILREFQQSVADYTQQHRCLDLHPQTITGAVPAPRIFTLPVAMVFRQTIAKTLAERAGVAAVSGVAEYTHATAPGPFHAHLLVAFPPALQNALPALPARLEYRLIGHDLVIRDKDADLVVDVLRDAVGPALTVIR